MVVISEFIRQKANQCDHQVAALAVGQPRGSIVISEDPGNVSQILYQVFLVCHGTMRTVQSYFGGSASPPAGEQKNGWLKCSNHTYIYMHVHVPG